MHKDMLNELCLGSVYAHERCMMTDYALPIGNFENKYENQNPVARRLVSGFLRSFDELVALTEPATIHEVGCGEGMLTARLADTDATSIKATDLTEDVFRAQSQLMPASRFHFEAKSVYDLERSHDSADLVICCEVLEHLEEPARALDRLFDLGAQRYLFSVPREPIWRIGNMMRGKYIADLGNTPGHLNHWSGRGFLQFVGSKFDILEVRHPLPWTMILCAPRG